MESHESDSFTLALSDEERSDWSMIAELAGETLEMTIRRLMGRAVPEKLDYDLSRQRFPS
jgi:hypothetical protein